MRDCKTEEKKKREMRNKKNERKTKQKRLKKDSIIKVEMRRETIRIPTSASQFALHYFLSSLISSYMYNHAESLKQ